MPYLNLKKHSHGEKNLANKHVNRKHIGGGTFFDLSN